jgi:hypothetical protein
MGFLWDTQFVVTGYAWDFESVSKAYLRAKRLGLNLSGLIPSDVNAYWTFLIAPDGSKNGFADQVQSDMKRTLWMEEMRKESVSVDWVYIMYGGNSDQARIQDGSQATEEDPGSA